MTDFASCEFSFEGQRCVFGAGHSVGYHHLQDGRNVDAGTGAVSGAASVVDDDFPLGLCIRDVDFVPPRARAEREDTP